MAKKRRQRGTGTIQKQRDGSFIARTAGRERSGRFITRSDAEEALDRWNTQLGRGVNPNDSRQRVRDFAATWLAEVVKPHKRPRTLEFYKRHIEYALPYIGDTALEAVTTQAIERMLSKLRDGLSPRSVGHIRAVLRNMFGVAKRWRLIVENPAADTPAIDVPEREEKALTVQQVALLLNAVEHDRLCALYHVALTLGLRRGELLGLRWSDIDFESGTLTVAQQVSEDENRHVVIAPYTKSKQRTLPLPSDLAERLRQRQIEDRAEARTAQQRAAERAGADPIPLVQWNALGLVFPSDVGTMILPSNFNRRFTALVRQLGLPAGTSPHTLRHTALTDLAAHGEAKAVQSIAGHADIDTTMRVYAGRRMGAMRAAVEAVEEARRKAG